MKLFPKEPGLRQEADFQKSLEGKISHTHLKEKGKNKEGIMIYQGKTPDEMREQMEIINDQESIAQLEAALKFSTLILEDGGHAFMVGGAVRDELFGKSPKDIDIEVFGLEPEKVKEIAGKIGKVNDVGKAFGVLKIATEEGADLDISLPRIDSKVAEGHQGFEVKTDPHMPMAEAAKRRDFTWNALSKDILTGEIYDPIGGVHDALNRVLKITDFERFGDDPLRVLRAAQFVGRLGLEVDAESDNLLHEMVVSLHEVSQERFREEWYKLFKKSQKPSLGLQSLMHWGVIREFYPELHAIRQLPQNLEWHPEGDVWVHTLMVVDEAKLISQRNNLSSDDSVELMFAALCHDIGKATNTQYKEKKGEMVFTAEGHEKAGGDLSDSLMEKFKLPKQMAERIKLLIANHMKPRELHKKYLNSLKTNEEFNIAKAIRNLARKISPATIDMLSMLCEADYNGRGPFPDPREPDQFLLGFGTEAGRWLRAEARKLNVEASEPSSVISGKHLIGLNLLSKKDGRIFGDIIRAADEVRDELGWSTEDILSFLQKEKNAGKKASDYEGSLRSLLK